MTDNYEDLDKKRFLKLPPRLRKGWIFRNGRIYFIGSPKEFENWRKRWYKYIPKCEEFTCCHESISCGIHIACGDCSIHPTMYNGAASMICETVDCASCMIAYKCLRRK